MKAGKVGETIMWILTVFAVCVVIMAFLQGRPDSYKIYALDIKQNAQFHGMSAGIELLNNKFEAYPPSGATDPTSTPYCGAMKLCEAMMGRDLLGFHSDSIFRADGRDAEGKDLYDPGDLSPRRGPFLPPECADALRLVEIYGKGNTGPFPEDAVVLCDVFRRKRATGTKAGMPVLYYRADRSKTAHDVKDPNNPDNIYNYKDNHALLGLGVPGQPDKKHPLFTNPEIFYKMTRDTKVANKSAPIKADSFIVISAGYDGLYGTKDDIGNFEWKWSDDGR